MSARTILSVSTSPEIRERLDRLAAATRRSRSFIANEAIERYLAAEEAFIDRIGERMEEAERGEFLTSDELRGRLAARLAARQRGADE